MESGAGLLRISTHKLGDITGPRLYAVEVSNRVSGLGDIRKVKTCPGGTRRTKLAKPFLPTLSRPHTMPTKPPGPSLPSHSSPPSRRHRPVDFRTLYYSRNIRQVPPPTRESGVSEEVQKFRIWQSLDPSRTEEHHTIPNSREMELELTINAQLSERRGYFRQGANDSNRGSPELPSTMPNNHQEISPASSSSKLSAKQPIDVSKFPGIFQRTELNAPVVAKTGVTAPDGPRVLHSRRRDELLYSRMRRWQPKPVTYNNFFLPEIGDPQAGGVLNVFDLSKQDNKQNCNGDTEQQDNKSGDVSKQQHKSGDVSKQENISTDSIEKPENNPEDSDVMKHQKHNRDSEGHHHTTTSANTGHRGGLEDRHSIGESDDNNNNRAVVTFDRDVTTMDT